MPDADDLLSQARASLEDWRERAFADWLTVSIGLAALSHPEELRKALGSVFDLKTYEESLGRLHCLVAATQAQATECRELLFQLHQDFDRLEKRIDGMDGMDEWLDRIAAKAKRVNQK